MYLASSLQLQKSETPLHACDALNAIAISSNRISNKMLA